MWTDGRAEGAKQPAGGRRSSAATALHRRAFNALMFWSGDMTHLDKYMEDKAFVVQLAVWILRGVSRVILANNPVSGALVLAALYWASPWQGMLGTVGVLASTLTALIIGQDSAEVSAGLHGFNGMLVSLLMGVFSSAGDWYLWLLLPVCVGSAACTFLFSALGSVLDRWDLPVAVYPFNTVITVYLLCTTATPPQGALQQQQQHHPYYPHHLATPPGAAELNATQLDAVQVLRGVALGVGQIYACGALGPSVLILASVLIYSPLLALHAVLGSAIGTLAGVSMAVRHGSLYEGLSGFNGALGCMAVGGLFFTFNWKTHLLAITTAFFSAYVDIALSNMMGILGLPACSWAATLVSTAMLLLNGQTLAAYRLPIGQVMAPEQNLRAASRSQWEAGNTSDRESTDV